MILTLVESKCYPLNHLKNHITRPNIMALLTPTGNRLSSFHYNKINYLFSGDDSSKKVNMSDYELRGPSHVRDISNIVNKLLYLHKKVVI